MREPPMDIEALVAAGRLNEAAQHLAANTALSPLEKALQAYVELQLGSSTVASNIAESVLRQRPDARTKIHCLHTIGRALCRQGSTDKGLATIRKAIAAAAADVPALEPSLLSGLITSILSGIGVEPALAELPRLRRSAVVHGDRGALVDYHLYYARIAVMREWWKRAEAELEIASNLIEGSLDTFRAQKLFQLRCNVCIKMADLTSALKYASQALSSAESLGFHRAMPAALNSLAHVLLRVGRHDEARGYLQRGLELLEPRNPERAALYSTGLEIGLGAGDDSYCEEMVQAGDELTSQRRQAASYYDLWWEVNRVKWLILRRDYAEAAARVSQAVTTVGALADADLLTRMRLLGAEALALGGHSDQAAAIFAAALECAIAAAPETLSEMYRVAAAACSNDDDGAATRYLGRARRILLAAGLNGLLVFVDETAERIGLRTETSSEELLVGSSSVEAVSIALELGTHQDVLDAQMSAIARACGLTERAVHIEPRSSPALTWPSGTTKGLIHPVGETLTRRSFRVIEQFSGFPRLAYEPGQITALLALQESKNPSSELIAASEAMLELSDIIRRIAPSNITVLITGETGTGKELLARALHDASSRTHKRFIPFNCTAIAREMLDAQLFGYRRGAFTGATEAFPGVIRAAAGGTLFLDEIGELSSEAQPKLLRFLESGEIHPLGEPAPLTVDVRIVAATNANLEQLVADGRFREDLFYRLNVVRLEVPPLRDRREEIPLLVQHFVERASRESHKTGIRIAEETMEYLVLYRWPGNVRQLANVVRKFVALAESGAVIMPEHLTRDITASRRTIPASERDLAPTEFVVRMDQPMSAATEHLERSMIQYALRIANGRVEDAAQRLGLSRKGLYLKRQRLNLDLDELLKDASAVRSRREPPPM
jgi:DNA-binding NtrC family response regulator/tetratricopeptide (TPR) repeat protein